MLEKTGIPPEEFEQRRQRLAEKMPPSSIALLPGGIEKFRNRDTEYPFRQESNFYYLTGFCEPQAFLVLLKKEEGLVEFILFCQPNIPEEAVWNGKRAGQEEALRHFGAHRAYSIKDLDLIMPGLLENHPQIFYSFGQDPFWDKRVMEWQKSPQPIGGDLISIIHELRLIKSPAEIVLLQEASRISAEAHISLMESCQPNRKEYELEALFLYKCFQKGCRAMAYSPIVGGGANACTLHYIQNNKTLHSDDLVLVDAGAEYRYYAADITRTFPVNGKFTEDQKALYELVLKAQLAAIEAVRPGIHWNKLQEIVVEILVTGLVSLGILKGTIKTLIEQQIYKRFYMHGSGHWLGLDVHDAGEYKLNGEYRPLKPGMVLTVEPGIYISSEEKDVDKRWRGIGIRIEDDVLVTERGHEVLTQAVPKTVTAIEKLMNSKK